MIVEILYPEVCNLYGDLFNAELLARSCGKIKTISTSLKSEPLFVKQTPDMIYMGSAPESGQELAARALIPYRERIAELIDGGTIFLLTGNAGEVFGTHIETDEGNTIECLNLLNVYGKRQMMRRYNSLYLGKFKESAEIGESQEIDIVGFKSLFSHSYGDNTDCYFIRNVRGAGLNPDSKYEGIRKNNLFSTYLTGPLLLLNPPLAKYMMRLMGIDKPALLFENECMDSYRARVADFSRPGKGFVYKL